MKKILVLMAGLLLALNISLRADEGMWLLTLLKHIDKMHEMGLELTADQIYSINQSSLKDAIGALDHGSCTAELVSAQGLLLTNHHCGYGEIQNHSSLEHDYLKNGFWAMSMDEELPNPNKSISFVVRMEDVTDQIMPLLGPELTGRARDMKVETISEELVKQATDGTHYEATVRSFYNGNNYYLIVTETYKDVRLVGAPPESIGKFGHDTDNWMWPRHTGDFSIFRVYTGPDGKPAEYSPDNIPLKPKHFLPVSLNGYNENDYAMVIGFPGSTDRYMTSYEVKELLEIENPNRVKIRGILQDIMMADMLKSDKVRIQYSSKYSRSSNYWKYSIGQSEGLINLRIVQRKQGIEDEFRNWVTQNDERKTKYGETLELIRKGVEGRKDISFASQYLFETMYLGIETLQASLKFRGLYEELVKDEPDKEKVATMIKKIRSGLDDFYKDYNLDTDKKITKAMLELMLKDVPEKYQPTVIAQIQDKYKGDIEKYLTKYYKNSIIPYREKVEAFLDDPSAKVLKKDPAINMMLSFLMSYFSLDAEGQESQTMVDQGRMLWIEALKEMYPERDFYPDANSTQRLTYGKVSDYKARDAVYYSYYTTLEGVMEKEDANNPEFVVSERLKELYEAKNYGPYGMDGIMPVNFTTNNDITGGNSGSPVMNGKGELIGIAFDGNWEAMSGDIAYETQLQKCICVDIRYVLFVIDIYAGAKNLIDEMTIVTQ